MPIFQLMRELPLFPSPENAEPDGLLAVGGDLSEVRLLEAYRQGIFPWYEQGQPILWWSPDPRLVLYPNRFSVSRSLRKVIRKQLFEVRFNSAFKQIIHACADVRLSKGEGTWITQEMKQAYIRLHRMGYAHSTESWLEGELVGGLYGIRIGSVFFGESMFSTRSNASKVALAALVEDSKNSGLEMIDCQMSTEHLMRMGATEIPRSAYLAQLQKLLNPVKKSMKLPTVSVAAMAH